MQGGDASETQGEQGASGCIALAGFMMTAEEWRALDAPSRALLIAIAAKPEELAELEIGEPPVDKPVFPVGSAPIAR